ncbi:MAG: phosphotransferase [Acidimicrobiales bacterium]|jgi:PAS domain-containing protein
MPEHAIPTTVEQVTPAWLTDALRGSGALQDGTVTGFDAELIGQGVGIMGLLHRLTPTYDGGSGPATVVLKTPVDHEMTRFVARTFQFYSKEVAFYRTAAARSPLTTPRCLASAHDPESDDFVLLLEDLGDAEAYDQLDGCPPDLAEAAVRALARHHTEFWETPSFGKELSWLPYGWDPPMPQGVQQGVTMAWEPFLAGFGDHVDDDIRAIGERFPSVVEEMMYFPEKPTTLAHGDYRLDNLFFRRHEDGTEVIAIDWQICVKTVGAYDLGYFLSQSLTIEDRRAHEERLLDVYRSTLAEADIDYPADELLEDYRRTVLFCLCYPIQAGGSVELVNDRAVQLVGLMLDRVVAAIRDLDAASLMP